MVKPLPRVSVALPVYNGEDYLGEALEDLLCQDFEDFELIISDNASTDRTSEIAIDAARRDRRVRYIRHLHNIGATRNFETVIEHARAPYFLYAAHDDRRSSSYLARLVGTLDTHPRAVLACADSMVIDEFGMQTGKVYPSAHTVGFDVVGRIRLLISQFAWVETYGLMRTNAIQALHSFKPYSGGDVVLLLELSLLGEIATIHEPLFLYRMPSNKVTNAAYYAALNPTTFQDPRTYTALIRYLYRAVLDARLGKETSALIRHAFVETIGNPHAEWFAAVAAENGLPLAEMTMDSARSTIDRILSHAEAEIVGTGR